MRFKAFLNEQDQITGPKTIPIEVDEAIQWIKQHAPRYAKNFRFGRGIYRGMGGVAETAHFGDSKTFRRKSLNTKNYYTLLMSTSPLWKDYPDREHSFVCASDGKLASSYGTLFWVFPEDHTKIGICSKDDLWYSFPVLQNIRLSSVNTFALLLHKIGEKLSIIFSEDNSQKLRSQLRSVTHEHLKDMWAMRYSDSMFSADVERLSSEMVRLNLNNLEEASDYLLNPKSNSFKIDRADNLGIAENLEVWFNGQAVFIPDAWFVADHPFKDAAIKELDWPI